MRSNYTTRTQSFSNTFYMPKTTTSEDDPVEPKHTPSVGRADALMASRVGRMAGKPKLKRKIF
jgi:hypothetical protein